EGERALGDRAHALLVRVVDSTRVRGRHVLGGRPSWNAFHGAVHLVAAARPVRTIGLEGKAAGHDETEARAPGKICRDVAGARIGGAMWRCDDEAGPADASRDVAGSMLGRQAHRRGGASVEEYRAGGHAS